MIDTQQIARTEQRYEERITERAETEALIEAGAILEADTPERVRMRLERKGLPPAMVSAVMRREDAATRAVTAPIPSGPELNALERIIGTSDLIRAGFLASGACAARSVCRIEIGEPSGLVAGYGTGVLISSRLLLTNNHVLHSAQAAASSTAEFGLEEDDDGQLLPSVRFALEPDILFVTDPMLDYTVVAVASRSTNGSTLAAFGWVPLIVQQGKVIKGEYVNIVQHPNGEPKQLALRENQLVDLLTDFIHYRTDTAPGSSGAPVFNDEWEMVALHHSGVPARDASGNILAIHGSIWTPAMGEHRVRWVANEGARVSRIVAHLRDRPLEPTQRRLLDEALAASPPPAEPAATMQPFMDIQGDVAETATHIEGTTIAAGGTATWTIPLQVTVHVGAPVQSGPNGDQPTETDDDSLAAALADLQHGRSHPYYDEAADAEDRERYYADISKRLARVNRFAGLSELVRSTHREQLRYEPRRHIYPWVDLQPNGMLRSIYTGQEYDPAEFIREDLRIEQERAAHLRERLRAERAMTATQAQEALDLLESELPYNCEHVVPQSWFEKREPMRGDLHHLFACESRCNSFRRNIPYFEFPEFDEAVRRGCGMVEGNRFEPSHGKGPTARATLYFLVRYPCEVNRTTQEYEEDRLAILVSWHVQEPPTDYERHRNAAIFAKQGNRNPLIDYPEWVDAIDFTAGLGM